MTQTASAIRARRPRTVTLGGHQVTVRALVFCAGVTFWLGNMIVHTGSFGIAELRASLSFVIELVVITSATRTVSLNRVAALYCCGGTMMGVVWLISTVFTSFIPSPDAVSRQFFVPFIEESLKLAPVVYLLWRGRRSRSWTMGASDIMVLAAASGGGFGLVEEAYFHLHYGPTRALDWLQLTRINGPTLTFGHSTWSALAGATLGLALLWRPRKPLNYLLAWSGLLWSILDHSHHNYAIDRTGVSVDLLNIVAGYGWISLYLFVPAVIAVLASDLYVVRGTLPASPELKIPRIRGLEDVKRVWRFLLARRGLAYLMFKSRRVPGRHRAELILQGNAIDQSLARVHNQLSGPALQSQSVA
jgi:RsiW-degrading membrane proteinase PrsW (M82 family)